MAQALVAVKAARKAVLNAKKAHVKGSWDSEDSKDAEEMRWLKTQINKAAALSRRAKATLVKAKVAARKTKKAVAAAKRLLAAPRKDLKKARAAFVKARAAVAEEVAWKKAVSKKAYHV